MKSWSHLPNAHHIDWVLKSVKENPELWVAADDAARIAARTAARSATWSSLRGAVRGATWDAVRGSVSGAAWCEARDAAWGAIAALIVYDDCDQFLNMPYEKLKVWAVLSEAPCAILLLPMVYVREHLNEQCMVTLA